jgi:class 3 adenylate cyclase
MANTVCSQCGFDMPGGALFCENCGHPVGRACPNCNQPVSATARFCKNCGFNLAAAANRTVSLDALRKSAPPTVVNKILAERDRPVGERKLITALFTDIVGSTTLAEQLDPEDWREIVTGAHRRVSEAVYRYEGTIAQLLGDGVLAFFGAPIAHEDDAERAIRAALDILAAIDQYAVELRTAGAHNRMESFQMRVGLNSGLVVVGQIGSDLHMEYTAIGDTVNLAARMQTAADPNTVLVADNTQRLAASLFDFEDRGQISVKGKSAPIQVYRVLRARQNATRLRGIAGLSSALVGRQRELATLLQITTEACQGRGSIVSLIAEAGLGKSRLVAEWRKAAQSLPVRWIEGRCLSYAAATAHHLSTDLFRHLIAAPAGAREEERRAALRQTLENACVQKFNDVYPFLAHLLGLKLEEEYAARVKYLDGPALQHQYITASKLLISALAHSQPIVLICEDVHWADPASVELGAHVLPIAAEAPIVFVFIARPDKDAAGWRLVAQAHEIPGVGATDLYLTPLAERDSRQLIHNLLEIEALPEAVRQLILRKAEGNPFFVEEVVRMLIDRGHLAQREGRWFVAREIEALDIPDTLQGILTARLDRLPDEAKRALQIAAVIGRRFSVEVLQAVLEQDKRSSV